MTTRVASITACSDGSAASQSGKGYDPTTVVLMRGSVIRRNLRTLLVAAGRSLLVSVIEAAYARCQFPDNRMADLPDRFRDTEHFEDVMTTPAPELVNELGQIDGDI